MLLRVAADNELVQAYLITHPDLDLSIPLVLTELTASLMNAMMESFSPKVAFRVRVGTFINKLLAMVCVPGSLVGKDAMNVALVQFRFCAKCIRPASTNSGCKNSILSWYHTG